jgi:hypothetical protein
VKEQPQNTTKDLRKFSLGLSVLLMLLALAQYFWGGKLYLYFLLAGLASLSIGLIFPAWMKPLQWLLIRIGNVMNWIMTNLILALLFYFVFTLVALIWRLIGHRPLDVKFPDPRKSYWRKRTDGDISPQRFEKQF